MTSDWLATRELTNSQSIGRAANLSDNVSVSFQLGGLGVKELELACGWSNADKSSANFSVDLRAVMKTTNSIARSFERHLVAHPLELERIPIT